MLYTIFSHARASLASSQLFTRARTHLKRALVPITQGLYGDEQGQGTTEYAILVGVLVVIAILAIIAFKGKVQELWNAIRDGINQL